MVKNLPASAGDIRDMGSISGSGRSPEEGHGNPLQHPRDREAWGVTVQSVSKSWTRLKQLSIHTQSRSQSCLTLAGLRAMHPSKIRCGVWGRPVHQVWHGSQACSGFKQQLLRPPTPWPVPRAPSSGVKVWSKHCSAEP